MNALIATALKEIPHSWKELFKQHQTALMRGLAVGLLSDSTPAPELLFEAFRLTPLDNVRVVLLGQDPYPGGEACGLSFSIMPPVAVPPSLHNINLALQRSKLSSGDTNGDLKNWAKQGVLLLNASLSTTLGKSDAHKVEWAEFVDAIIAKCAAQGAIFMLLGKKAQTKAPLCGNPGKILIEKHPSPLANKNKFSADHFGNTAIFKQVNQLLDNPIDWNIGCGISADVPIARTNVITYYTDGGARANGKPECQSSWALCRISGEDQQNLCGKVEGKQQSNNRGELVGLLTALKLAQRDILADQTTVVEIVSDSEYSIKSMSLWGATAKTSVGKPRENYDLVGEGYKLYISLKPRVVFRHVRGHQTPPIDKASQQYADWYYNDIVDKLCQTCFE